MRDMPDANHPTYDRLVEFTGLSQTELRDKFGLRGKDANLTNWKTRGLPADALVQAQAIFGVNAVWLRTGEGIRSIGAAATKADDPLAVMGAAYMLMISKLPESKRKDWHADVVSRTLDYLVSVENLLPPGTNPADK